MTQRKDGTRRSYQIEAATLDGPARDRTPPMLFVKYRYPSDEALRAKQEAAARAEEHRAGDAGRKLASHDQHELRNYAYTVQGEATYEPATVHDNGKSTTFVFRGNIEIPAIYVVRRDGSEELVPKNVDADRVIVHAISEKFVLRRGEDVLCVFNERFVGEGFNPATMTTSAGVARVVRVPPMINPSEDVARGRTRLSDADKAWVAFPTVVGEPKSNAPVGPGVTPIR